MQDGVPGGHAGNEAARRSIQAHDVTTIGHKQPPAVAVQNALTVNVHILEVDVPRPCASRAIHCVRADVCAAADVEPLRVEKGAVDSPAAHDFG